MLKNGYETVEEFPAFFKDTDSYFRHLYIPYLQGGKVKILFFREGFQQGIPLRKNLVVIDQFLKVYPVKLRNYAVDVPSPDLASFIDQVTVIG